ncbi:hypothetical protein D3C77_512120 [compost metagenome]
MACSTDNPQSRKKLLTSQPARPSSPTGNKRLAQKNAATPSSRPLMLAMFSTSTRRSSPGWLPLLACLSWRLPSHSTRPVPITAVPARPKKKYNQRSQGPANTPMCKPYIPPEISIGVASMVLAPCSSPLTPS